MCSKKSNATAIRPEESIWSGEGLKAAISRPEGSKDPGVLQFVKRLNQEARLSKDLGANRLLHNSLSDTGKEGHRTNLPDATIA